MDYIVLAIPVFFALIGVELVVTLLQGRSYFALADSLSDLGCGVVSQLVDVFLKTTLFAGYVLVYDHLRLFSVPSGSAAAWVACFLGVDFFYYWFHRMSHEVNAIWAAHVVHHQSEEYNLTVALRQGAFQGAFSWVFYLPLALLGFPPLMFLALSAANTLYQFWIHTRAIGRLGPLDAVFNTPSNHRVHHGRNPSYIDRNHGGTLIVWDRLFGTYAPEQEEPVYGITTPLASWNPVWANLQYWVELFGKARRTARPLDKVRLFLKPPGWHPQDLGGYVEAPEVDPATYRKFDTPAPPGLSIYAFLQFLAVLSSSSLLLFRQAELGGGVLAWASLAVVSSLVGLSALLERRPWALAFESVRLLALALAVGWLGSASAWRMPIAALVLAATAGLFAWLMQYRGLFRAAAPAVRPIG